MAADGPATEGRPRFLRHLRAEIGEHEVFVFDESGVTSLRGDAVVALASWLDGRHDIADIVAAAPGGLPDAELRDLIDALVDAGLVVVESGRSFRSEPEQAWWDAAGVRPARRCGFVGVTSVGGIDVAPFVAALGAAGLQAVPVHGGPSGSPEPQVDVVLCDDYLDPCLADVDAAHRAAGRPWLLVKPFGVRAWIGPFFRAGDAGCWECLAHRLWGHRRAEAVVQAVLGRQGPAPRPTAAVPPVTAAVAQLVALEVGKWVAGFHYSGQGGVWIIDSHDLGSERHELRPRPQCRACGDPEMVADAALRPVRLHPTPPAGRGSGGDRAATTADTHARFRHLVSPVTGIVKSVAADPAVPSFAHAYRSGPNLSRRVAGMRALRNSVRSENGGKGFTALEAEVGAICEAVERYCGSWQGDELVVRGSFTSLGRRALDPRSCLLFDDRQFAGRARWNGMHSAFNHVPAPFDPDAELDWTPVWSLSREEVRLLPSAMLYFGAPAVPSLFADSNGCAAGSSREDAVLQALLEIVERDAVALWWYNRLFVPGVDLAALADGLLTEQVANHASLGRRLWLLDVTSDVGIPVVAAVSQRVGGAADERILLGFGAHLDLAVAVRRALAEVNQMLGWDHVDLAACDDPDLVAWATTATAANQPYLSPLRNRTPTGPADHPRVPTGDIAQDVAEVVDRLRDLGMHTYVLDQTRPDVAVPVVRVVVPGMRTFWSRYGPGRLFDAPVQDQRLRRPTDYADLNPMPLFL